MQARERAGEESADKCGGIDFTGPEPKWRSVDVFVPKGNWSSAFDPPVSATVQRSRTHLQMFLLYLVWRTFSFGWWEEIEMPRGKHSRLQFVPSFWVQTTKLFERLVAGDRQRHCPGQVDWEFNKGSPRQSPEVWRNVEIESSREKNRHLDRTVPSRRSQRAGERVKDWGVGMSSGITEHYEFKSFLKRLPTDRFLNVSMIAKFWSADLSIQKRYAQLESSTALVLGKAQKIIRKLFTLSKRCPKQPRISLPRERPVGFWLGRVQSLLYCNEHGLLGSFSEEVRSCSCPVEQPTCQGVIPCVIGTTSTSCSSCAADNATRCGACHHGDLLHLGSCRPSIAASLDHYLNLDLDMPDAEVKYLLQRLDSRIEVHAIYISNDVRLGSWFNPAWRKRMLLTELVHACDPARFSRLGKNSIRSWPTAQCYNWTLPLGGQWKSFFETVHIYLRSRIVTDDPTVNETLFYEPLDLDDQTSNMGYMKINTLKVFGYSMHFDPEGIKDLILQLDYPYTQGTQDAAFLMLLEMRDRINRLSPPAPQPLDLFSCLLRHRLKLSAGEVARIKDSLQLFSSKLPNSTPEPEMAQLCS
ncbi:hypothetical protein WMY93_001160 [Mugilogobius chulae]|uniref:BRINP C-terminal domain-containing protein n=1 Tax=Mugilogobius chulae TaxID=88201 RepID=A0AAW0QBZ8_9GOBI